MAKTNSPIARLDPDKDVIPLGPVSLTLSELLVTVVIGVLAPLFCLMLRLPLPLMALTMACFPVWAACLFLVQRDGMNLAKWYRILLAYSVRQKTFRSGASGRVRRPSPWNDMVDRSASAGTNLISWQTEVLPDGTTVIHVAEDVLRPYRALVALSPARRALPDGSVRIVPSTARRPRQGLVEIPWS
jgi:hypothetical protein